MPPSLIHTAKVSPSPSLEPVISVKPLAKYEDLLTVDNMAELLNTSTRTIYRLCDKGELPFRKIGRRLYFPKHELITFLRLEEYCIA